MISGPSPEGTYIITDPEFSQILAVHPDTRKVAETMLERHGVTMTSIMTNKRQLDVFLASIQTN